MLAVMLEPSFRPLALADVDAVAEIVVRCDALTADWAPAGWNLPDGHLDHERLTWREDVAFGELWCELACDDAETIVGAVAANPGRCGNGPASGHIASLFVEPALHREGVGGTLLQRAERWLAAQGCETATLNVLEGSPAISFYEARGWQPSGRRGHFDAFDMATIGYEKPL